MINCEVSLTLTWCKNCILTDITTQAAVPAQGKGSEIPAINPPTNAIFKITTQNCMHQLLPYQLKMIINYYINYKQDLKKLSNGINTDQKRLIRPKLKI